MAGKGNRERPSTDQHHESATYRQTGQERSSSAFVEQDGEPSGQLYADSQRNITHHKSPSRQSSPDLSFFTLPPELRVEVYEHLAVGPVFKKRATCSAQELESMRTPPALLLSKTINAECTEVFNNRVPFFLDLPIKIRPGFFGSTTCTKLGVAFPTVSSDNGDIVAMPARHLSLRISLDAVKERWDSNDLFMPNQQIESCAWFKELLERLQGCPNLTDLSIRCCLPSAVEAIPTDKALHRIFDALVNTMESMPKLERYSVQIGSNMEAVSAVARWGVAVLSAYGRRCKGKEWEDESTTRYCCQALPYGEWYELLYELHLDPMYPVGSSLEGGCW